MEICPYYNRYSVVPVDDISDDQILLFAKAGFPGNDGKGSG